MNKPEYRYDIIQNSEEWLNIKLGMFSASCAAELLMDKKTKGYSGLINRIVEERITGKECENKAFKGNGFTNRGHDFEAEAIEDFELRTLQIVNSVGVVILDDWTLCSPDGLIGDNELIQIKCPIFNTQREYLEKIKKGKSPIDSVYYKQMQFELFVTGRKANIFTSYHPYLKYINVRVERDEEMIHSIKDRLKQAISECEDQIESIKNY